MVWSLGALPARLVQRIRLQLRHAIAGHPGIESTRIGRAHANGVIDGIEVGNDGTLAVTGWAPDVRAYADPIRLRAQGAAISAAHVFRVTRPDLGRLTGTHPERLGIVVEFVLPPQWSRAHATLQIRDTSVADVSLPAFSQPAYCELYGDPGIWHRDDVYGVGPPMKTASSELVALCSDLEGPLLDFGCGAGALVSTLRALEIDARGLELDLPHMRDAALPDVHPHVTYYSGAFPAPFEDEAFRTVTCCEVLEHIADVDGAIAELSRLARERLLVTVPDMSGVPRGYRHGVVPWHLLERSHVNFFTQQSLHARLRERFRDVQFFRIGEIRCNRMRFYTSLVALCRR